MGPVDGSNRGRSLSMVASGPVHPGRAAVGVVLRAAPAWIAAGLLGWGAFRAAGGPALRGPLRWGLWLGSIALAVAVGVLLRRRLVRQRDARDTWVDVAAVGWAVAIAAGWFLDVQVGGPMMGAVTAVALHGVAAGHRVDWRVVVQLTAALVGGAVGLQLSGGRGGLLGFLGAVLGTLLAMAGASVVLGHGWLRLKTVALVFVWGAAWYGAWALTSLIPAEQGGMLLVLSLEVVLAIAVGGLVTGLLGGRPFVPALASAIAAAVIAVLLSALVSLALDAVMPRSLIAGTGRDTWLDAANVVAMPLTVAILLGPLLLHLPPSRLPAFPP